MKFIHTDNRNHTPLNLEDVVAVEGVANEKFPYYKIYFSMKHSDTITWELGDSKTLWEIYDKILNVVESFNLSKIVKL